MIVLFKKKISNEAIVSKTGDWEHYGAKDSFFSSRTSKEKDIDTGVQDNEKTKACAWKPRSDRDNGTH